MSSVDVDVDINVVSSPEPSPRSEDNNISRNDYQFTANPHTTFNHSTENRLSPPKSPSNEHNNIKTSSTYTSFSISSILNRAEPKKGHASHLLTSIPMPDSSTHDAAMLSR